MRSATAVSRSRSRYFVAVNQLHRIMRRYNAVPIVRTRTDGVPNEQYVDDDGDVIQTIVSLACSTSSEISIDVSFKLVFNYAQICCFNNSNWSAMFSIRREPHGPIAFFPRNGNRAQNRTAKHRRMCSFAPKYCFSILRPHFSTFPRPSSFRATFSRHSALVVSFDWRRVTY